MELIKNEHFLREYLSVDETEDIDLEVEENLQISLLIANFDIFSNRKITAKLKENSSLSIAVADFSRGKGNFTVEADILGEGASFEIRGSSLALKNDNKRFDIHLIHKFGNSKGLVSLHGIAGGKSQLTFDGVSSIEKGAKKSNTRQEAKIIVIDSSAFCRCSPSLEIDENDVVASHGAVEGRLNDMELFYLESRGIEEKEARRLIAMGYLSPIARYFPNQIQEKILTSAEGGI